MLVVFKYSFQEVTEKPVHFSIPFGLSIYGTLINPQGIVTVVLLPLKHSI